MFVGIEKSPIEWGKTGTQHTHTHLETTHNDDFGQTFFSSFHQFASMNALKYCSANGWVAKQEREWAWKGRRKREREEKEPPSDSCVCLPMCVCA